ncbi:MAG: Gfo/Idh/MocA family oxidoreductase [Gemmatimonadota bacterium]
MSADGKYRVAVVGGAGSWGRHYLRAYAEHPRCHLVALVDRAGDRARQFAEHYRVPAVFGDVEELLRREVPDVVSVILPVGISHEVVVACAEAGVRAISCEKPIAVRLNAADRMVEVCRQRGAALGCGTAHWEARGLLQVAEWVRAGQIGPLTGAAIPTGLTRELSGGGCVPLTQLRLLTGREVEWVEGWTREPSDWREGWNLPGGGSATDLVDDHTHLDCPACGRLGLSGGLVCEVPVPGGDGPNVVSIVGEVGRVWVSYPDCVLIQGQGPPSTPVRPDFLEQPWPANWFTPVIERLFTAIDTGREAQCSGHDYRQALEIAVALVLSAQRGHGRVHLPLSDRAHGIVPRPYRLRGGDAVGWERIGHAHPPGIPT